MTKEEIEQQHIIEWCEYNKFKYPGVNTILHVPNGGKRTRIEGAKFKRLGVRAGIPDLFLPIQKQGYGGLFIELKVDKGKVSTKQKEWIENLNINGYKAVVCYGFEEAKDIIEGYMK